jgi:hypothetical protein
MAKNFAAIYNSGNDSSALNQSFFVKKQTNKQTPIVPLGSDFLYMIGGSSLDYSQSFEDSPHKTGRHRSGIIKGKTTTEWSLPLLINIKQGVAYGSCIDAAVKCLWENVLGKYTDTGTAQKFDATVDPSTAFTIFQNLDHMAMQAWSGFCQQVECSFAGDGMSQLTFSGAAAITFFAGIGKSVTANAGGNVITLGLGEGARFDVNSYVMLVKSDGVTRSTDTATARKVTAKAGDVITVDGAPLTVDSDGTALLPVYLCYWEPEAGTIVGINEPQTGLEGSVTIDTLPTLSCVRNATLTINNNHELQDFCFGTKGLSGAIYVPSSKLEVTASVELNLNAQLGEFLSLVREFYGHELTIKCGNVLDRHFEVVLPKLIFQVPSISIPETGSVPVTLEGNALQTALEQNDSVIVSYK